MKSIVDENHPKVFLVVENLDGKFLDGDYAWRKIPIRKALLPTKKLDEILGKMSDHVGSFFVNWAILFEGKVHLEQKFLTTENGLERVH